MLKKLLAMFLVVTLISTMTITALARSNDQYITEAVNDPMLETAIMDDEVVSSSEIYFVVFIYFPFGVESEPDAGDANPWRYCGEYFDSSSGTYYLRNRHYDPRTSRMLSPDMYWHPRNMIYGNNPRKIGNSLVPNIYAIRQSSNLYVYALNNPLRWIDPSGYVIELSSKATEAENKEYERAINYLMTSATAKTLIELLQNSKTVFTIMFVSDDNDYYDPSSKSIYWDVYSGLVLSDKKSIQSAALGLIHEMGHASQDLNGLLKSLGTVAKIEADNLKNCETPIANELGEYTRKDYYDASGVYRMSNSTDWGIIKTIHPWWHYIAPWNWGKPGKVFENQNPWTP